MLRLRDCHLQHHQKGPQLLRREAEQAPAPPFSLTPTSSSSSSPRPGSRSALSCPFSGFTGLLFTGGNPKHANLALEEHRQSFEARLPHLAPDAADATADEASQHVPPHERRALLHGGQVPMEQVPQALEREENHRSVRVFPDAPVAVPAAAAAVVAAATRENKGGYPRGAGVDV